MQNLKNDPDMSILTHFIQDGQSPAKIPVDIVDYAGKGYAYRVYHDDIQDLPEMRKADFVEWIQKQAKRAELLIGKPVATEVSVYE